MVRQLAILCLAAGFAVSAALPTASAASAAPAAVAQDPPSEAPPATAETLEATFPQQVGTLDRTSLRTGYRDDGHPVGEAEYGGGAEGPAGGAGGAGVSLYAWVTGGDIADVEGLLDRARGGGGVTDTTYMGHRAHRFRLDQTTHGVAVVTEGDVRAVVMVLVQGEDAPSPMLGLDGFDLDRLAAMAAAYRPPSFRTTEERPPLDGRSRAAGDGAVLTVSHPEGWTVQDLTNELDHPYLLLSREPVSRHLLVDIVHEESTVSLDGNAVVLVTAPSVQRPVAEALGHYGVPSDLLPDWEMAHDRRSVRVGGAEGQDRLVTGTDRSGTAYRNRHFVYHTGGRLVYVQTLEPAEDDASIAAVVEQIVESIAVEAESD